MVEVRTANQLEDLRQLLSSGGDISIAVAYVTLGGLNLIEDYLKKALSKGKVRMLVALDGRITDPKAVNRLVRLSGAKLKLKHFEIPGKEHAIYHPKLFISRSDESTTILSGSYNLTESALKRNKEHGLLVKCDGIEGIGGQTLTAFEKLWKDELAKCLTREVADNYESECKEKGYDPPPEETIFTWPSKESAFLMGAICARGKFFPSKKRIEISLQFKKGSYKDGKIKVDNTEFLAERVLPDIREEIKANARSTLPKSRVTDKGGQATSIDCSNSSDEYNVIWKAYGDRLDFKSFSLPSGLLDADANVVKEFVRGFSEASGLIGTNTKRGNSYVVWLRPSISNQAIFQSLKDLIQEKLDVSTTASLYGDQSGNLYHIEILAQDFQRAIGFSVDWRNKLVSAGAAFNAPS